MDDQDYCPNIGDEAIDKLDVAFKSGDWGGAESVLDGAVTSLLGVRNDLLTGVLMYARLGLSDTACYQRAAATMQNAPTKLIQELYAEISEMDEILVPVFG